MNSSRLKKLLKNHYVQKWILSLFALICVIAGSFMYYTYSNACKSLQAEYTTYSEIQTDRIAAYLDNEILNCQYVAILLSQNENVKFFLLNKNADTVFPDIYTKITEQLDAYRWSNHAIDSVYLYAKTNDALMLTGHDKSVPPVFLKNSDKNYLSVADGVDRWTMIFREKNNIYPYLYSIFYPVTSETAEGLVTVNVNLSEISILSDSVRASFQEVYIVSEEGQIIYRKGQQAMPEALEQVPQLTFFEDTGNLSKYVDGSEPYIYVQQHSQQYPWYYITITYPQNFTNEPFNYLTPALNFLPWLIVLAVTVFVWLIMLAIRPIRTISDFLEDPLSAEPKDIGEPETEKMIRQFIKYIESNQSLSRELKHQMELQNRATFVALQTQINPHFLFNTLNLIRNTEIEALGFEHEAPKLTLSLSKILRYALAPDDLVPLENELHFAQMYLEILGQRYGNKLNFSIDRDPHADKILIPKLIIQPLIENAVFHGCAPQLDKNNQIHIATQAKDGICHITVSDNGVGMSEDVLLRLRSKIENAKTIPSDSIGLMNVIIRMHLIFGEKFSYQVESRCGEGTQVDLSFPAL